MTTNAKTSKSKPQQVQYLNPRRPGIEKIAGQIAQQHPGWSIGQINAAAKIRWHEEHSK